ncbi:MAG: hypothetical protein ACRD0L_07170 [Acidimicrobiales bacterium]
MASSPTDWDYLAGPFAFRVRASATEVGTLLERYLMPFRVDAATPDGAVTTYDITRHPETPDTWSASWDGKEHITGADLTATVDHILWEVTQAAIARARSLALHAGAVSWQDRAVLLPAPSGSGKSTLAAGLTRAGCAYLTDELALIDPQTAGLVPFPRALWMAPASIDLFPGLASRLPTELDVPGREKRHVPPDDLRPGAVGGPCPVGHVVFPEYVVGSPTTLEPVGRAEAVVGMITNSFNFASLGPSGLELVGRVVAGSTCYRLRTGDITEAVAVVRDLVQSAAPAG